MSLPCESKTFYKHFYKILQVSIFSWAGQWVWVLLLPLLAEILTLIFFSGKFSTISLFASDFKVFILILSGTCLYFAVGKLFMLSTDIFIISYRLILFEFFFFFLRALAWIFFSSVPWVFTEQQMLYRLTQRWKTCQHCIFCCSQIFFLLFKFLICLRPCLLTFSFCFNHFVENLPFACNGFSQLHQINIHLRC